jgi:hypothetical protein
VTADRVEAGAADDAAQDEGDDDRVVGTAEDGDDVRDHVERQS